MNLSAVWQRILSAREPPLVWLLSLHPFGIDPFPAYPHLAMEAGALRYSTEPGTHVSTDRGDVPFWPWLMDWPAIERRIAPQDRRAEITTTTVRLQGASGLGDILLGRGGPQGATARLDLWSPGLTLDQALPLLAGRVENARFNERMGAVEFNINEGPTGKSVNIDPGTITLDEFPRAPAYVAGKARRTLLIGGPRDLECPQISPTECYVCEGHAADPPTVFRRNTLALTGDVPAVAYDETASTHTPFTKLVFRDPATLADDNLHHVIEAQGVTGFPSESAISFLMDLAGIKVTRQAEALFAATPIKLAALSGQNGDALAYARDQLIPQTDLAFSYLYGRAHAYRLRTGNARTVLGIGTGLLWRMDAPEINSTIFNRIEVLAGRTPKEAVAGAPPYLVRALRDKNNGDDRIRDICARSEARYGARTLVLEARDVVVAPDERGDFRSPAADSLADSLAEAHALPWRAHRYKGAWLEGMSVELNQECLLTDSDERLDRTPARIVGHAITPTGVELTFGTQLDPTTIDPGESRRLAGVF